MAKELEIKDKYTYNPSTDTYVINLKNRVKPLVVSGSTHRAIIKAFSDTITPSLSLEEIAVKYKIPTHYLEEYKKIFSITRDSLPLSNEQILEDTPENNVKQILEEKKFNILQILEKESWKEIQDDAMKWREFQHDTLDPFARFVENIQPITFSKLNKKIELNSDYNLIIGLSDIHFGSFTHEDEMFHSKLEWDINKTMQAMNNYIHKIQQLKQNRKYEFQKIYILFLGDILHSLSGDTVKGTELEAHPKGERQYEIAFESCRNFLQAMIDLFPQGIEVKGVTGNHSVQDLALLKTLKSYFRTIPNINFDIKNGRFSSCKINNTLIIFEHGASAYYKNKLPSGEASREAYIQRLVLSLKDELHDINHICYISADQHHMETCEYAYFEHIMFSSLVGADRFSDHNNLANKPRQNGLVINSDGVIEMLNFFV